MPQRQEAKSRQQASVPVFAVMSLTPGRQM
uniref:Uncharacterized protein n=1 Tax=Arundo donax TaxID=35708 RepID=A0A0A9G356_ARUDO